MKGVMPREQNSNHQISPSTPVSTILHKLFSNIVNEGGRDPGSYQRKEEKK